MALTIKIDKDEEGANNVCEFLRHVSQEISNGFMKGEGWEVTGTDEDEGNEE